LYKNLQEDMRKPRVQSINELKEKYFILVYLKYEENEPEVLNKRRVITVLIVYYSRFIT
jgi:hypothetical protein